MDLERRIEQLQQLPADELKGRYAADLEDVVQRGLAAVHSGEMWIHRLERELAQASTAEPERAAALKREIATSRAAVRDVRAKVGPLHERAQELGVGTPAL